VLKRIVDEKSPSLNKVGGVNRFSSTQFAMTEPPFAQITGSERCLRNSFCDPNHKLPRCLSLSKGDYGPLMDKQRPRCGAAPFFAEFPKIEGDHGE